jgi:hypothetical protein
MRGDRQSSPFAVFQRRIRGRAQKKNRDGESVAVFHFVMLVVGWYPASNDY